MNGYYKLVIEVLKAHGYRLIRQGKGSHEVWGNEQRNQIVSKNMPSRDMANTIMKQAKINHRF
ncbi:type II toxin-antitoxin system HicA family toxin [Comamonas denitrificans]|uniref:type II toxin-antitoxin system HicA family toxin n=1 Tax=Comamonas denitrificans TaxID=117506 RepID=UPI003BF9EC0F